jgi:phenylacetic acid degradation operon negative regulatory protein
MTTDTSSGASKLAALLASFERRRPMRAGSLIVTIYGDAIVPRGGSLWLSSLLDMMAGFGVEPGLVRTAVSRLVADGWFERTRIGRNSSYCLSNRGADEFAAATARIYRAGEPVWDGEIELVVITAVETAQRTAIRDAMLREGYGQVAVNVVLRPRIASDGKASPQVPSTIRMFAQLDDEAEARKLAAVCWQLDELDRAYRQVLSIFEPVAGELADGLRLTDTQAFQLRILLIHDWRRIVLRDPLLPRALLHKDWPGTRALALVSNIYRRTLAKSERWLDKHAANEQGPLPRPSSTMAGRFRAS